jgi:predicted phosphodiesterase
MRVAAIYDIHGNLPALEAVLGSIAREGADLIVVGGDVVCGPMTAAVMDRLLGVEPPADFIRGNAEASVLTEMAGADHPVPFPESIREVLRWEAGQLQRFVPVFGGWPMTLRHRLPGLGDVLFCHATPRDLEEIFLESTPEHILLPIFEVTGADVVVCGHTHMQFDRTIGRVRVVNAGSVGMPFDAPGAYWLMLGPGVEFRRTDYDLEAAAARVRATSYPQAHQFADGSILAPPSAAAMRAAFEKLAIGAPAARRASRLFE